jgi:invasion protein IalB
MPIKPLMRSVLTASILYLLMTAAAGAADKPQSRILSERFDDWFYRCVETGAKKSEKRCEVVQIAQSKQGKKPINLLTISFSELPQGKTKKTVLTVLTPLNVFLPEGLGFAVDKKKNVTLQYRNCNSAGCWIQHFVDAKTLRALKSGNEGVVNLRLINGQNLKIKFSLKGLKPALAAMQKEKSPKTKSAGK